MAKVNPNKIPRTQADVEKAFDRGCITGCEFALNLIMFVLKDKHNTPDSEIIKLRDQFMYINDSIARKYVSYQDIKKVLKEEYDLAVEFIEKEKIG